jgi:hypothetical protein
MSKNYINDFIMFKYNFAEDEITEQFISFLKSLS